MSRTFSQERKEKAAELDPEIDYRLAEYYCVPETRICSLETISDREYSYTDDERGVQLLDYAGYDKVIDLGTRIVSIAQRVRDDDPRYPVDFTIRTANRRGTAAEYDKILNAWKHGGAYPTAYVHAVRDNAGEMVEFVLVDVDRLCEGLSNNDLSIERIYSADDGSQVHYYSIDDLRQNDCILTEWRV